MYVIALLDSRQDNRSILLADDASVFFSDQTLSSNSSTTLRWCVRADCSAMATARAKIHLFFGSASAASMDSLRLASAQDE